MTTSPRGRLVAWDKEDGYGVELVDVNLEPDRLTARGVAIGWEPLPYHLEFTLETSAGWVTSQIDVRTRGDGWARTLELHRSDGRTWTIEAAAEGDADLDPPGGRPMPLTDALDCDLGLSPLTNTMPVLRTELLHREGSFDFVMAWVSVPALAVRAAPQRYTALGDTRDGLRRIEYRSLDGDFVSTLTFDTEGLVVDYPQLARRVS